MHYLYEHNVFHRYERCRHQLIAYLDRKKHLDKEFNKYFYISLLKAHASGFGKQYYFIQNLISSTEIDYTGLSDICREALDRSSTRDDAFEFVNQRVCVHKHVR